MSQWTFWQLYALPFRIRGAVIEFNRASVNIVALARRWLAIPVLGYYDGFAVVQLAGTKGSATSAFKGLVDLLGWCFDTDKDQPPTQ